MSCFKKTSLRRKQTLVGIGMNPEVNLLVKFSSFGTAKDGVMNMRLFSPQEISVQNHVCLIVYCLSNAL